MPGCIIIPFLFSFNFLFFFHPFHFLPFLVLTELLGGQSVSFTEFHSIDGWPVGQCVLEIQLAHATHGKGCSKSYQIVAGEQKTGVVREVALRKETAVKIFTLLA